MPDHNYERGDSFPVQFVWQIPDGDFIRAIFEAQVLALDFRLDRYRLRLTGLKAGRQEAPSGAMRARNELSREYWAMVGRLVGREILLAFEVDDGRPVRLRLDTLTLEHSFFTRLDGEADS